MTRIIDRRRINLSEVLSENYVPYMGGRPKRKCAISVDDQISLHQHLLEADTVEEVIDAVH